MALVPNTFRFIKLANNNVIILGYIGTNPVVSYSLQPGKDIRVDEALADNLVIPVMESKGAQNKFISISYQKMDFVNSTPSGANPTNVGQALNFLSVNFFFEPLALFIGGFYIEKTYAQAATDISNNDLEPGALYKITDRGDRGIFIHAISTNEFERTGTRLMLCPTTYDPLASGWIGVWNASKTVSVGEYAIWGGFVWENLNGVIGSATDESTLDSEWALVSKVSFANSEYLEIMFGVEYDFSSDKICKQWDEYDNVFIDKIELADWNYATCGGEFYSNHCFSVYNNSTTGGIFKNRIFAYIFENNNTGSVSNNSNNGGIGANSNDGDVSFNSNNARINANSNIGSVSFNSNNGEIRDNSNIGDVSGNSNNGSIYLNENTDEIYFNQNNGYIGQIGAANDKIVYNTNNGDILTTTTGTISDAVVNK